MDEMPDELYKFCKKEHNLSLDCSTVRIGSYLYYQNFEDSDIGDFEEGIKSSTGSISIQEEKVKIHSSAPNNFIFSLTTDPNQEISDYNSCYKITNPSDFAQILMLSLLDNLTVNDVQFPRIDPLHITLKDVYDINLYTEARKVQYLQRSEMKPKVNFNDMSINSPFDLKSIPFWKDVSYQDQKEFRFLFLFTVQGIPNSEEYTWVEKEFIDLDISKYKESLPVENFDKTN